MNINGLPLIRYWIEARTEYARLQVFRVLFFGLAAFDIWSVMLEHAARYGAGHFNVSHFPILDQYLPVPTPYVVSALWLFAGFTCLRAALGIASRLSITCAAFCYFGVYLWSQVDSYQHHYLVALLMLICAMFPDAAWSRPSTLDGKNEASDVGEQYVQHPLVNLIYVQVGLVYFWTAIAKCNPTWLTGATLDRLTTEPHIRHGLMEYLARMEVTADRFFESAAWATTIGEFFAALCFVVPSLRIPGLLIVPWFHVGVELLGLDIEWFSYYMLAIDFTLLAPASVFVWLNGHAQRLTGRLQNLIQSSEKRVLAMIFLGGALLTLYMTPLESTPFLIVLALALFLVDYALRKRLHWIQAAGNLLCAVALVSTVHISDSAYDYYRLWGGDLRRRGDPEASAQKYIAANELKDEQPARRLQLGRLYEQMGRSDEAIELYLESIQIFEKTIEAHRRATFRSPEDADLKMDLGEDLLRLADRYSALGKSLERRGDIQSDDYQERGRASLLEARESAMEAVSLSPIDQRRAQRLIRQVQRAQKRNP